MLDLKVSSTFVKRLTKNIRDAYGKDIQHTKVLELIADAFGQKAGPMMHQLKQVAAEEKGLEIKSGSKLFSTEVFLGLLKAIRTDNIRDTALYMSFIDTEFAIGKLLVGLGRSACGYPKEYGQAALIEAFFQDERTVMIVAGSVVEFPSEVISTFLEEHGIERSTLLLREDFRTPHLTWAAKVAVDAGFLGFSGQKSVVRKPKPDLIRQGLFPQKFNDDHIFEVIKVAGVVGHREEYDRLYEIYFRDDKEKPGAKIS